MDAPCVFCGRSIADGEPSVGRPPHAAHAACADAALADDLHWDAVAAGSGVQDTEEPTDGERRDAPGAGATRRLGCAMVAVAVALTLIAARNAKGPGRSRGPGSP